MNLSDLISMPPCSSNFLLNVGLWLVHRSLAIIIHNHSLHCFHIGTVNLLKERLDLISLHAHSHDVLTNASPWLTERFLAIISAITSCIAFILEMWTHMGGLQMWFVPAMRQWILLSAALSLVERYLIIYSISLRVCFTWCLFFLGSPRTSCKAG